MIGGKGERGSESVRGAYVRFGDRFRGVGEVGEMMPMEARRLLVLPVRCPEFGDFMMNRKGKVGFRRKHVGLDAGEVGC